MSSQNLDNPVAIGKLKRAHCPDASNRCRAQYWNPAVTLMLVGTGIRR